MRKSLEEPLGLLLQKIGKARRGYSTSFNGEDYEAFVLNMLDDVACTWKTLQSKSFLLSAEGQKLIEIIQLDTIHSINLFFAETFPVYMSILLSQSVSHFNKLPIHSASNYLHKDWFYELDAVRRNELSRFSEKNTDLLNKILSILDNGRSNSKERRFTFSYALNNRLHEVMIRYYYHLAQALENFVLSRIDEAKLIGLLPRRLIPPVKLKFHAYFKPCHDLMKIGSIPLRTNELGMIKSPFLVQRLEKYDTDVMCTTSERQRIISPELIIYPWKSYWKP